MSQTKFQGEYTFHMHEMVAGFKFSTDGKFDFYYSYGAVDRTASGTFTVEGKTIKLKSNKEPGKDFTVTNQSKQGEGYSIKVEDENKYLLNYIRCSFFVRGERHDEFTDEKGIVKVNYPHCDSIFVFHTLFPDFVTCIKDDKNENNNFTLTLNPSLAQVSFKGIDFTIDNDSTISCMHNYLMPLEDIHFIKQ
jgi:hypothetical protein